ncbi:MAG: hypothetical protein Q8P67_27795 [archaeon]|nr:hypothetical protein [archaeon]
MAITDAVSAEAVLRLMRRTCHPTQVALQACQRTVKGRLLGCRAEHDAVRDCAEHVFCPQEFVAAATALKSPETLQSLKGCMERQEHALRTHGDPWNADGKGHEDTAFSRRMAESCQEPFDAFFACAKLHGRPGSQRCADLYLRLNSCTFSVLIEEVAPEVLDQWTACLQREEIGKCLAETGMERQLLRPANVRLLAHGMHRMDAASKSRVAE